MAAVPIPKKRSWPIPTAIVVAAVVLRIAYLLAYREQLPFAEHPFGDAEVYLNWARQLAASTTADTVFYRAPLYPYLVAFLLKADAGLLPIYVLQSLLGLGTLLLTYATAHRLFGFAPACIALGLLAFAAPLQFFESKLLSATPVLFLVTLGMFLVVTAGERRPRWAWLLAGLVFGLSALAWPGTLVIFAALCIMALAGRTAGRKALPLSIAACIAVVAAVTIRNAVVESDFVPISANGGFTFYQGNNRLAAGTLAQPPEVFEFQYEGRYLSGIAEQQEFEQRYAESKLGPGLRSSQVSGFWFGRALSWITHNPGAYLILLGRKLVLALSDYESPSDYNIELEMSAVWPLRLAFARFGMLLAAAVLGLFLARDRRAWPVYSVVLGTFAALLLFYVADRYRLPMLPALAVLGGVGLHHAWRQVRFRRLKPVPVLAAVAVFLLSTFAFTLPLRRGSDLLLAGAYHNLSATWASSDPVAALSAAEQAQAIYAKHAATLNPQERLAAAELARLLRTIAPPSGDEAVACLQRGDTAAAVSLLEKSIGRDSTDRAAWLLLGSVHGSQQRHAEARVVFAHAARWFPSDPVLQYNLALAAFKDKDFAAALAAAERVLVLAPGHEPATRIADASRRNLARKE